MLDKMHSRKLTFNPSAARAEKTTDGDATKGIPFIPVADARLQMPLFLFLLTRMARVVPLPEGTSIAEDRKADCLENICSLTIAREESGKRYPMAAVAGPLRSLHKPVHKLIITTPRGEKIFTVSYTWSVLHRGAFTVCRILPVRLPLT